MALHAPDTFVIVVLNVWGEAIRPLRITQSLDEADAVVRALTAKNPGFTFAVWGANALEAYPLHDEQVTRPGEVA